MKNTFGNSISITLFGESHGEEIGVVLDGFAPGIEVDEAYIAQKLALRRPIGKISTGRVEPDHFRIVSGVFEGHTTGTAICVLIPNENVRSRDYEATRFLARPGHADYAAFCKYGGYEDYRGGGHFSGRLTAPLVAAGAIAQLALEKKGIRIGTHIARCAGIADRGFENMERDIEVLAERAFAVLDESIGVKIHSAIEQAAADGDSVGGVLETAVTGLPAGVGEPWFDSLEGVLSHALFSIPAVKGVEFGDGFAMADMRGSEANDGFAVANMRGSEANDGFAVADMRGSEANDGFAAVDMRGSEAKDGFAMSGDEAGDSFAARGGAIVTKTNHNGGINGGISNGMPILFRCAVKPTPSIYKEQDTVDFLRRQEEKLQISGRHDPAIVHRARVVVDSVTAIVLCDMLALRYGTDYLREV